MLVLGDVHGQYNLLMRLLDKLPHDNICFVGDLIDRGSDSDKVVEFVKSNNYLIVKGNHEDFLIKSKDDNGEINSYIYDMWMYNGGKQTLDSYHGKKDLLETHREWMKTLPLLYWIDDKTVVSHSYYLPYLGKENDKYFKDYILWERNSNHKTEGILNIHGHTIIKKVELKNNYVNVDTGGFYYKILSAYDTDTGEVYQVTEGVL